MKITTDVLPKPAEFIPCTLTLRFDSISEVRAFYAVFNTCEIATAIDNEYPKLIDDDEITESLEELYPNEDLYREFLKSL
jgi:hypothetical protein